jgi:carbonic anhydrase
MRNPSSPNCLVDQLLLNNQQWADEIPPATRSEIHRPQCLWIECSECPVSPAVMTGAVSGELLVHRNLGNLATDEDASLSAILELALVTFRVQDIVICGHGGCVAIDLAMVEQPQPSIDHWLSPIIELATEYDDQLSALTNLDSRRTRLCELNVEHQVWNLARACATRQGAAQALNCAIHGWMFQPSTNRITDLGITVPCSVGVSGNPQYGAFN